MTTSVMLLQNYKLQCNNYFFRDLGPEGDEGANDCDGDDDGGSHCKGSPLQLDNGEPVQVSLINCLVCRLRLGNPWLRGPLPVLFLELSELVELLLFCLASTHADAAAGINLFPSLFFSKDVEISIPWELEQE